MADERIYLNNSGDLTSEQVAELLAVPATAYDLFLIRNNLHDLRTKIDDGSKQTNLLLKDIKESLEVEIKNGSVKKAKLGDLVLEHHGEIKNIKKNVVTLDSWKNDSDRKKFFSVVKKTSPMLEWFIKIFIIIQMIGSAVFIIISLTTKH